MHPRIVICIAITIITWGTAFIANKIALAAFSPLELPLFRYLIGSVSLLIIATFVPFRIPEKKHLPRIFAAGFLGISFYNYSLYCGQLTILPGIASLLTNTAPIFTAILSVIILREKISQAGWLAIFISFVGVVIIVAGKNNDLALDEGCLWVLAAAISLSFYFIVQKPLFQYYSSFEVVTYSIWADTIWLLPAGIFLPEAIAQANITSLLVVCYLGILPGAIGYYTWSIVSAALPASKSALYLFLIPVTAFVISFFVLGEIPSLVTIFGGMIVIGSIFFITRFGKAKSTSM